QDRAIDRMDFILSLMNEDDRGLYAHVDTLCRGELGTLDRAAGEADTVNRPLVKCLADVGLLDWVVPGAYGTQRSRIKPPEQMALAPFCLIRETLARSCPNAELIFTMQGLGAGPISFSGNEDQRRRYLPRVASGELVAAFALTEPDAGSDVAAMNMRARRDG